MTEITSRSRKYEKPQALAIDGLDAAEGFCISSGVTAYGKTCTNGPDTTDPGGSSCSPGGSASQKPPNPLCNTSGSNAANCWVSGIGAGG